MIDEEKLEEEIIALKKSIARLVREQDKDYIGTIEKFNQRVVLAVADFKCQACGSEENLQIHHLILRKAKEYMDFWRYASQRYYWANQIVLCMKCHIKYHKEFGINIGISKKDCITKERINKIKKKFKKDKMKKNKDLIKEIEDAHDCKKCHEKIIAIGYDKLGNTCCAYCGQKVKYPKVTEEEVKEMMKDVIQ